MITLDVPYIFKTLGGAQGVLKLFDFYQPTHNIPYNTIQMWKSRNSIPVRWVALVIYVWLRKGHNPEHMLWETDGP